MPPAEHVLAGLEASANAWWPLAAFWHACLGASLLVLARSPGRRAPRAAWLTASPVLSVALISTWSGNPFNAVSFAVLAVALTAASVTSKSGDALPLYGWARTIGVGFLALGWVYPHFLHPGGWRSLYAAPLGVIPCPTLLAVTGLMLAVPGLCTPRLALPLVLWGLFYGAFGAIYLGVAIDWALFAGAIVLAGLAARRLA